jgi:hypothetical protein
MCQPSPVDVSPSNAVEFPETSKSNDEPLLAPGDTIVANPAWLPASIPFVLRLL